MSKPELRQVFCDAAEIEDPAERAAFLERVCAGDGEFRRRIERLLAAGRASGSFLRDAPGRPLLEDAAIGRRIGRYRVLERVGKGGYGVVYRAEQEEPVRREVALKVIKLGMDTSAVVARFDLERQALALMDHPNIARALDAGATDEGRPFFVMEMVRGLPITDYCRERGLSVAQRIELFIQVCHGVQHAHQKGIIHRDLKPSNVLVAEQDGVPVPKIIDFGIAKATESDGRGVVTGTHEFIGTPAYVSPEQLSDRLRDVDTRSDIYGLGVILYELVAGRPPFDPQALREAGLDGMRRVIRESEPVRPSAQLLRSIGSPPGTGAGATERGAEDAALARQRAGELRVDLDWIVMKCLEKDRARRYPTANALAADLRRHLEHEPVSARPPSPTYRLRKTLRRHRVVVSTVVVVTVALVAAVVVSLRSSIRATRAEREQNRLRVQAEASEARSRAQLVRMTVLAGNAVQESDLSATLLWYVEALKLDRNNPEGERMHRQRIHSLLRNSPQLEQVWFHDGPVQAVAFSPDGTRVVSGGADKTARVWDVATGEPVGPVLRPGRTVYLVQFTPDGRGVLTVNASGEFVFWDAALGERRCQIRTLAGYWQVPMSRDGRRLAAAVKGGLQFFDTQTGQATGPFMAEPVAATRLCLSPDDRYLVSGGKDARVRVWDVAEGRLVREWQPHPDPIARMRLSPDGRTLVTVTLTNAHFFDLATGTLTGMARVGASYEPYFSPDSSRMVTCGWVEPAQVWRVPTGEPLGLPMRHRGGIGESLFNAEATQVATLSWDRTARVWDAHSGQPVSPALAHMGFVHAGAFSPDGTKLVTGEQQGVVRLWNLTNRSALRLTLRHAEPVLGVDWSPDGARLFTAGLDKAARVWEAATGALRFELPHPAGVCNGRFLGDGTRAITAGGDGGVRVWEIDGGLRARAVESGQNCFFQVQAGPDPWRVLTLQHGTNVVVRDSRSGDVVVGLPMPKEGLPLAVFSPDGARVMTAFGTNAQIWNVADGRAVGAPMGHPCEVTSVRFSRDGRRVVTACSDHTQLPRAAQMWDAATGRPLGPPLGHLDGVFAAEFSPDGRWVATGGEDNAAMIWDAETGQRVAPSLRHSLYVSQVTFSPDSRYLLTVSHDRTARVWDVTGEPLTPPLSHDGAFIRAGAWHPDGREVVTVGDDGSVRVWDISPTVEPIEELQRQVELLAAHRLAPSIGLVTLTPEEMRERWRAAKAARSAGARRVATR